MATVTTQYIKSAINDAILESVFWSELDLSERYGVAIKPKFDTACWAYYPPHQIYIGDKALEKVRSGIDEEVMKDYVASLLYHEMAHMIFTERDLKQVNKDLAKRKIPFSLFNLFEDARIENFWRLATERPFAWTDFEDPPAVDGYKPLMDKDGKKICEANPATILFRTIQLDGEKAWSYDGKIVEKMVEDGALEWELEELYNKVHGYYERILKAKESHNLYPILDEWIKEFPAYSEPEHSDGLSLSSSLMASEEAREKFEEDMDEVQPSGPKESPGDLEGTVTITSAKGNGEHMLVALPARTLNKSRVGKMVKQVARLLEGKAHNTASKTPSKRVSARHFAVGRDFYRRKEITGQVHKKVSIVVDCSGSMGGFPMEEGMLFVSCFNELAKRGDVSGHLILSAGCGVRADWLTMALPVPDNVLERVHAYGGSECLEHSMRGNIDLLRQADLVMVYTDANITDTAVNKAVLHTSGVYTYGLYVGSEGHASAEMAKYFDKSIIRNTVENLVDAMLVGKLAL